MSFQTRMKRRTARRLLGFSLALTGLATWISLGLPMKAEAAAEKDTGTFHDSISANPVSLFSITNTDGETSAVPNMMFESLLDRNWDSYEWMPMVASKWEVSADGKEFTFTIDKRAKFWDGKPVTAEDVKFSYDIIFMQGVESAPLKPYYDQIAKVEILGPDKVKFVTKDVYYKNFDVAAGLTIYQKDHYMKLYKKDKTMSKAESTKSPMGTGPWQLEKWDDNQQLILKRNPNYWAKDDRVKEGRWNYDRYVFKIIPEQPVEFEAFKKGEITYKGLTPKQWSLQSDGPEFKSKITKVKTVNKAAVGYGYIGWNGKHPILGNKDVRWALSHMLNMPLWIEKFDFGLTEPTVGPYSPKSDEHDPAIKAVKFDPKEARKRLAAAGWKSAGKDGFLVKDGKKFEITIIYPTQSKDVIEPKLTEYKNQAAKVGISILLKAVEWTSFTKLLDDRNFDGVALAWTRGIDGDLKQIWHSASIANKGSNFVSYSNPEVDKLIDEHRRTLDRAKRVELARKLQKLIYEDQPYTFMTERKYTLYAHQNYVKKPKDTYNYTLGTDFWKLSLPQ